MSNKIKIFQKTCQTTDIMIKFEHNQVISVFCHRYKKGKLGTYGANKTQEC